jgi:hypothetical protein
MQRRLIALTLALLCCVLAAACGGGGSKPMTLEEYFQALKPILSDLHSNEAPLLATLGDSQNVQELQDALRAYPAVVDTYADGLKDLRPPEQAKQAQKDAVTASGEFLNALNKAIDATEGVTTVDDFFGAADAVQITLSSQGMTVACDALQQLADVNQITIDLGCPASSAPDG